MNNLLTAIRGKATGSTLSTYVGGRIYLDEIPENVPVVFPHVVYRIVGGSKDDTFTEDFEEILIEFLLVSTSSGATEITTMYNRLTSLYDECILSITSKTFYRMHRPGPPVTYVEDVLTQDGTQRAKHWAVDYDILYEN